MMTLIARFQVDGYEPRQGSARILHDDKGAYFELKLA
jgi:hypothetical protein